MPGGNGTGPGGMGPMTGRGAGFCAGYSVPGYGNSAGGGGGIGMGWGRGRGRGFGRGFGFGRGVYGATTRDMPFAQNATAEQEISSLKGQAEYFENFLSAIKQRIEEIESQHENNAEGNLG